MRLLISIAAAILSVPAAAQGQKELATLSGAETVFVPKEGAAFALMLAPGKCERVVARVAGLALGARQLRADRLTATILQPGGGPGPATLLIRDSTVPAPEPTAAARPGCPAAPPVDAAQPSPAGALIEQGDYKAMVIVSLADGSKAVTFPVQFKKQPATLKADATLRLERVVWRFGESKDTLALLETSGTSELHLAPPPAGAQLTDPAFGRVTLTPSNDLAKAGLIPPGGEAQFDVGFDGRTQLGTTSGSLTVRGPELAGGAVSLPVELKVRGSRFWLFFLILAGLVAGYVLRTVLERKRTLDLALADAYAALRPLQNLQAQPLDPDEVPLLAGLRRSLDAAISDPAATDATVREAVTAFKTALEAKLKEMAERRSKAANALSDWSAPLGEAADQPVAVAEKLQSLEAEIRGARDALHARLSKPAEDLVERIETHLKRYVAPAIADWAGAASAAIERLPDWPELPAAKAAQARVATALAAAGAAVPTDESASFVALLRQSSSAMRAIRRELLGYRAQAVDRYALELQEAAKRVPDKPGLADRIAAADKIRLELAALAARPGDPPLADYADCEARLFRAWRELAADVAVKPDDPALARGEFLKVLAAAENRVLGGDGEPARFMVGPGLDGLPEVDEALLGRFRIDAPASAWLGEQIQLTLVPLEPGIEVPETVRWIFGTGALAGGPTITHQPATIGALTVQAVIGGTSGQAHIAFASIEVMRRWDDGEAATAGNRARRIGLVQTAVSGLLIAGLGYGILGPAFVGTYDHLLAAFGWGFATDLGLAKAVELAAPLATRLKGSE